MTLVRQHFIVGILYFTVYVLSSGLVLPPQIAPVQVVLIPLLTSKLTPDDSASVLSKLKLYASDLEKMNIRCEIDSRTGTRVGAKYYEWERKGVPLRIVLGSTEMNDGTVTVKSRVSLTSDGSTAHPVAITHENLVTYVEEELKRIQSALYGQAKHRLARNTTYYNSYSDLLGVVNKIEKKNSNENGFREDSLEEITGGNGFYLVPWCPSDDNEKQIKSETKLTIRCFPNEENFGDGAVLNSFRSLFEKIKRREIKCFYENKSTATKLALFARNF